MPRPACRHRGSCPRPASGGTTAGRHYNPSTSTWSPSPTGTAARAGVRRHLPRRAPARSGQCSNPLSANRPSGSFGCRHWRPDPWRGSRGPAGGGPDQTGGHVRHGIAKALARCASRECQTFDRKCFPGFVRIPEPARCHRIPGTAADTGHVPHHSGPAPNTHRAPTRLLLILEFLPETRRERERYGNRA
jgi:hypothetical protein